MDEIQNLVPKLKVLGLGGAGCNAVDSMIENGVSDVEFIAANTDAQSLALCKASRKIQLGRKTTRGLGSGSKPEVGLAAAEESIAELAEAIEDADILFLAGGMGGGTGSGAMPVAASLAREKGVLSIAVVTTPFDFEGEKKSAIAKDALAKLSASCDCLIVLPNQNLYKVAGEGSTFKAACKISDNVLLEAVKNLTDLIMKPGLINLDFADIRAVMESRGRSIIGVAIERGENRAARAVERALANPLFASESIHGASGLLVNITGNADNLALSEVREIMDTVRASIDTASVDFVFGTCFDESMGDDLKVAIIATGIGAEERAFAPRPSTVFAPMPKPVEPKEEKPFSASKPSSIEAFIEDEAKEIKKASELFASKDDDDPEPPKGRKPNPLTEFFTKLGSGSEGKLFDDVAGSDIKLSVDSVSSEEDNVVFLAGSVEKGAKEDKQIDLMEMIRKMEENLELPAIFKRN
ncbi:MAG: cell division protein FtsZ [Rickettsiales bacterium]|nr:cell division protein FtsZ [Rickettsiales bacterium]